MRYRGSKTPLREIGRVLGADTVLEGTVGREASRVHLTVQLMEAETGTRLWAGSYERELTGTLMLQSDVARAIAQEIRVKLSPQQETRLARAHAVKPATYEAYLKGMY